MRAPKRKTDLVRMYPEDIAWFTATAKRKGKCFALYMESVRVFVEEKKRQNDYDRICRQMRVAS